MSVNRNKPSLWKKDILQSVDLYNEWFIRFAPKAFRETRILTTKHVEDTLKATENLTNISPEILRLNPGILPSLRMSTCPPLARDRLIGLANIPASMVLSMEKGKKLPAKLKSTQLDEELEKIGTIIKKMADRDILPWLDKEEAPTEIEVHRAATIIADRLCGATADPIIRNAQETRQLGLIGKWLNERGYKCLPTGGGIRFDNMPPGTYGFRMNVPVKLTDGEEKTVNIPVDAVVMRQMATDKEFPLLIEAKSAGDFTNVNKRRKEEAKKIEQLRKTYGDEIEYILFLCGYFDSGYLGYEAAEGIDWVWEHRISDLESFEL